MQCPCFNIKKDFNSPEGSNNPKVYIVMESPGRTDAEDLVIQALSDAKLEPDAFAFMNTRRFYAVACPTYSLVNTGFRTPSSDEVANCSEILKADIRKCKPDVLLVLGGTALYALVPEFVGSVKTACETEFEWEGIPIRTFYSPSYVLKKGGRYQSEKQEKVTPLYEQLVATCKSLLPENRVSAPDTQVITDTNKMTSILKDLYSNEDRIGFDIETNGYPPHSAPFKICGISLATSTSAYYFVIQDIYFDIDNHQWLIDDQKLWALFFKKIKSYVYNMTYEGISMSHLLNTSIHDLNYHDVMQYAMMMQEKMTLKLLARSKLGVVSWEKDQDTIMDSIKLLVKELSATKSGLPKTYKYLEDNGIEKAYAMFAERNANSSDEKKVALYKALRKKGKKRRDEEQEKWFKTLDVSIKALSAKDKKVWSACSDILEYMSMSELTILIENIMNYVVTPSKFEKNVFFEWLPLRVISTYCASDAYFTLKLADLYEESFRDEETSAAKIYLKHAKLAVLLETGSICWDDKLAGEVEDFYIKKQLEHIKNLILHPRFITAYNNVNTDEPLTLHEQIKISATTSIVELKKIYNPASTQPSTRRIFTEAVKSPRVKTMMILYQWFQKFKEESLPKKHPFYKYIKMVASCNPSGRGLHELKRVTSLSGKLVECFQVEIWEQYDLEYHKLRDRERSETHHFILEDFSSLAASQIESLYEMFKVLGLDVDDRSTWLPEFEMVFYWRYYKKVTKSLDTYINGSLGRSSVFCVEQQAVENKDPVPTRYAYSPIEPEGSDYLHLLQTNFNNNGAITKRWRAGIHCLTGDTEVLMTDGTTKTLRALKASKHIATRHPTILDPGVGTTYSYDPENGQIDGSIHQVHLSGYVDELMELSLENGETIKCTLNHRFLLTNGEYKEAQDLTENDELRGINEQKVKIKSKRVIKYDKLQPVYDLSMRDQEHPCFALKAGVFSHNTIPWASELQDLHMSRYSEGICLHTDACLVGSTKVRLTDGRNLSIKDLHKEFLDGKKNYVISVKDSNYLVEDITNVFVSKETDELVEIEIDTGDTVQCTPNHRFLLRDGTYKEAKDLKKDDSLFPCYLEDVWNYGAARSYIVDPDTEEKLPIYKLSDNYNERYGLLRDLNNDIQSSRGGFVRHHVDYNSKNDDPTNIQRYRWLSHVDLHKTNGRETTTKLNNAIAKRRQQDKEYDRRYRESRRQSGVKGAITIQKREEEDPEFKKQLRAAKSRGGKNQKTMEKKWKDSDFRKQKIEEARIQMKNNYSTNSDNWMKLKIRGTLHKFLLIMENESLSYDTNISYDNSRIELKNRGCSIRGCPKSTTILKYLGPLWKIAIKKPVLNHKVVKVTKKKLKEKIPVYDITVKEGSPCFALSIGIISHNSQAEVRLLARLANEESMIQAYRDGIDVHTYLAAEALGKPMDQVTEEERRFSKARTFSILYGKTVYAFAYDLMKGDVTGAQALFDGFFERFPGVETYINDCHKSVVENGYVTTLFGDRIWIDADEAHRNSSNRKLKAEFNASMRDAQNYGIQSSSSTLIGLGLYDMCAELHNRAVDFAITGFTHDAGDFDFHCKDLLTILSVERTVIENNLSEKYDVPLVMDYSIGVRCNQLLDLEIHDISDSHLTAEFSGTEKAFLDVKERFSQSGVSIKMELTGDAKPKLYSLDSLFQEKRAYSWNLGQVIPHVKGTLELGD